MALFGPVLVMDAKTALNEVTDSLREKFSTVELANINELTWYFVFSVGCSAGKVKAEEAHNFAYAGTWALNGSEVVFGDNVVKTVKVTGVSAAQRARISEAIVNGTLSIWVMGR